MKIIVNNDQERALMRRFIEMLQEIGFEALVNNELDLVKNNKNNPEEELMITMDEYQLLQDVFTLQTSIEVDPDRPEFWFDDDSCITGVCMICHHVTEGTEDGEVTYSDYLRLMDTQEQGKWFCSDCYMKQREEEWAKFDEEPIDNDEDK